MSNAREEALRSDSQSRLILGGPGVGKTYFGCQIADYELKLHRTVKHSYQRVLFLTFARNAVARIREAYSLQIGPSLRQKDYRDRVRIETFAGFFWWLVESYGRYASGGSCLRPWLIGSNRIGGESFPEGYIGYTYEEIQKLAFVTISLDSIRRLVCDLYPLVIVDEHQDVDETLHVFLKLLSTSCHLVLLRGPGQSIYQGMKYFSENQIYYKTLSDLNPAIYEIESQGAGKQRHCKEIASLIHRYDCNAICQYDQHRTILKLISRKTLKGAPKELETDAGLMVLEMKKRLRAIHPNRIVSIAVLASTNLGATKIHHRLIAGRELYRLYRRHATLLFDDAILLQYGRLILALLGAHWISAKKEPPSVEHISSIIAALFKTVDELCESNPSAWMRLAEELIRIISSCENPRHEVDILVKLNRDVGRIDSHLRAKKKNLPTGTPATPFTAADNCMLEELSRTLINAIECLIGPNGLPLSKAKRHFEQRMIHRIMLEKLGIGHGVEVMTIHKSKGLEFDGVVLILEDNRKALWQKTGRMPDEELVDLYRVAISRARDVFALVAFEDSSTIAKAPIRRLLP